MAELNQTPAKNSARKTRPLGARVDLTAMVDLAFLLVTFFMLTTRLEQPKVMSLTMPDGETVESGVPETRTVTFCLGSKNQVLFYRGLAAHPLAGPQVVGYGKDGLRKAITGMTAQIKKETGQDMIAVIKPSDHSQYGNLVGVIDELNITNSQRYAVADIAKEDVDLLKLKKVY